MDTRDKILNVEDFVQIRSNRDLGRIVFTNGCFDILHPGHVDYLERASSLGDTLVVGLNSDKSVSRLKGPKRPVNPARDRTRVLAGLACVGFVLVFEEDTPYELICKVRPHVLVKGGDWPVEKIVGRDIVEETGGMVLSLELTPGHSTSRIIDRISNG
ncbi:D-glycero-beta-D-manno-heptose 1-phosphate adenylyltransferase [Desulfonatronovibrio hydrogenovorans]|uniref:D-glycero-beta-D-manno-heptose 1-phosphate adenylyltransferase n=1 Tax=Desulfonatronovibrio hydrogenovorans TaxID=53245 RepID=UPI00048D271C|nr:D-glycero-beta-D-manno-heptose 1-phosphate adenylyltransferase [Desulfonatronovibrio hydrogenovorans]